MYHIKNRKESIANKFKLYTKEGSKNSVSYEIKNKFLIVEDSPSDILPRELLLSRGVDALSSSELLAVLLSVGTKKEDVFSMSKRILSEYGHMGIFSYKDPEKLSKDLGLPLGKSLQIIACAELGRRFFGSNIDQQTSIRSPQDVYDHVVEMRKLSKEQVRGLYLNQHYTLLHEEIIAIGSSDVAFVHARDVFSPAIRFSACAVVVVHNHPSGELAFSSADKKATTHLRAAGEIIGVELLDHVIVSKNGFCSLKTI